LVICGKTVRQYEVCKSAGRGEGRGAVIPM
jgi:hypothetical protein